MSVPSGVGRITVIGVGLIGGSLARAVRTAGWADEIVGCGRDPAHLEEARSLAVIDRYETDIPAAVADADVIIIAVPLGAMRTVLEQVADGAAAEAIITDVGSAKGSVASAARAALGTHLPYFVPGHPIAGTEKSGVAASFAELFVGHSVILTPLPETHREAIAKIDAMWTCAGARVMTMEVEHHDSVLAATSHLPHVLAYSLVDTLARMDDSEEIFRYAAGGFRDFTRIASSDPLMWRDICLANRDALLEGLDRFTGGLGELRRQLEAGDGEGLMKMFARAKAVRDKMIKNVKRET